MFSHLLTACCEPQYRDMVGLSRYRRESRYANHIDIAIWSTASRYRDMEKLATISRYRSIDNSPNRCWFVASDNSVFLTLLSWTDDCLLIPSYVFVYFNQHSISH